MKVTCVLFFFASIILWQQNVDGKKYLIETDSYDDVKSEDPAFDDYFTFNGGSFVNHGDNMNTGNGNINVGSHNGCPTCSPKPNPCRKVCSVSGPCGDKCCQWVCD